MRFSLRSLFVVVTLSAVLCAVLFAVPAIVSLPLMALSTLGITPACIAGIVYGRGKKKAFAIGCLTSGWWVSFVAFYYLMMVGLSGEFGELLSIGNNQETVRSFKIGWVAIAGWICLSGLVSVGVRWLVRPAKIQPTAQPDGSKAPDSTFDVFSSRIGSQPQPAAHSSPDSVVVY